MSTTLCIIGLVSAKSGEVNSKEGNNKLQYGYLYQSTCGWTFNMYTDTPIGQMAPSQYDNYMDELSETNDRVCKLHGEKPVEVFYLQYQEFFQFNNRENLKIK